MAVSHSEFALHRKNLQGEPSPLAIGSKKLAMWLFIIADAGTFAALLSSYGYLRITATDFPHPFKFSPNIINAIVMTFILSASSGTMVLAVSAGRKGNRGSAMRWIGITIVAGIIFIALHLREWLALIRNGVTMSHNPWGMPLFGASFFSITGLHLAHVASGIVVLSAVAIGYFRDRYTVQEIEVWALYWYFVEVVWMFVMPSVYLGSIAK